QPGYYGLSNHLIDTEWPKVSQGKNRLQDLLNRSGGWGAEDLFALLADRAVAPDRELPNTGVGLEWERALSPLFITSPNYGTRSSTVLLIETSGEVTLLERSFVAGNPAGEAAEATRSEHFTISPSSSTDASDRAAP
ncbi:MAG: NRDE family protein, partial [Desulfobacterales bacterium]